MTEKWKSNPMFWCDYCKVWMQDNPSAKATHERGMKHKENVAKKLRQMRQKADSDKKEAVLADKTMSSIEAAAKKQYEKDLAAAKAVASSHGEWVLDEGSGHYYNAAQRYYFSRETGMYYGGDPPAWTLQPEMPPEALFKAQPKAEPASTSGQAAKTTAAKILLKTMKAAHPLAGIGGYQMPKTGRIGGSKGVGVAAAGTQAAGAKRKREEDAAKAAKQKGLSEEERKALAAREAARARVQQRTMSNFGLAD
ncbi:g7959 [Coccomyxa elongata]